MRVQHFIAGLALIAVALLAAIPLARAPDNSHTRSAAEVAQRDGPSPPASIGR
ncbi:MAG TPA: hypothetical protein VK801_01660 [Caulobacteraceae bacterium]|nr:hypothetical protein [Caulobacteraceae bacterium]